MWSGPTRGRARGGGTSRRGRSARRRGFASTAQSSACERERIEGTFHIAPSCTSTTSRRAIDRLTVEESIGWSLLDNTRVVQRDDGHFDCRHSLKAVLTVTATDGKIERGFQCAINFAETAVTSNVRFEPSISRILSHQSQWSRTMMDLFGPCMAQDV
jgi:hypothetical protein